MCLMVYISMVILYISFPNPLVDDEFHSNKIKTFLHLCSMLNSIGFSRTQNRVIQKELQRT